MCNTENANFYDGLSRDVFEDQAVRCGIFDKNTGRCFDIEETRSFLEDIAPNYAMLLKPEKNGRALVAGIGFGREIHWLLKETDLTICAIDHSDKLIDDARREFADNPRVEIHKCDILDFTNVSLGKFEIVLWMWSGILEVLGKQKQKSLKNFRNVLVDDGILVIESLNSFNDAVFDDSTPVSNKNHTAQRLTVDNGENKMTMEFISDAELDALSESAGLQRLGNARLYLNGKRQINLFQRKKP